MAHLFAERGNHVVLVSRAASALESLAAKLGPSTIPFPCDISVETELERLFRAHPHTNILVNCAGLGAFGRFDELAWTRNRDTLAVNVLALGRLCHHYTRGMIAEGYGRVLNVASTWGEAPVPYAATYAASKAFVITFSYSLALELENTGVTVTCLLPSSTATGFNRQYGLAVPKRGADPRKVAEFGLKLMDARKPLGAPGFRTNIKRWVKFLTPHFVRDRMATRRMQQMLSSPDDH